MRIAHVSATFPPYYAGTGLVCYHNALELARRGHRVTVFTAAHPPGEHPYPPEIEVRRLPVLFRSGNAPFLPGLLKIRGFDLIHLHYPFFGGEPSAIAAWLSNTPLVITYHQDALLHGIQGKIEKILRWTVERWVLRSASRVLFTSMDYARASYIMPILKGREEAISEMPNGVDPERFFPGRPPEDLERRFRHSAEEKIVLLVAGLDRSHYFKGVPVLLQALSQLPPTVKGVIVGDGDLRAGYEQMSRESGISSRVFFPGRVAEEKLPDFYRLADVTVLPSTTMGEAFGLVLLESLACGTPVIASNLPGVRSVVSDGRDGLLAPPGDVADLAEKMDRLLNDPALCHEMGRRGRARVEGEYAWERAGERLEQLYLEVLATRAGQPVPERRGTP
jgi:glycosyltransferase involved in cell wall biosynthesis